MTHFGFKNGWLFRQLDNGTKFYFIIIVISFFKRLNNYNISWKHKLINYFIKNQTTMQTINRTATDLTER